MIQKQTTLTINTRENTVSELADIQNEIAGLKKQLNYHNNRYYVLDSPEISDAEYDNLMQAAP
jgi:DNA ligase (NAD+)